MSIEIIAVAAIAAIGAGVSAYSTYEQGKTADSIAQYNARQNDIKARHQLLAMEAQAALQRREVQTNFNLRAQEAQAAFNNAKSIENQAEGQSTAARESDKRRMVEYGAAQGTQRALIAKSGFVESTGTPLDILAETAATIQLEREDAHYADGLNRLSLFREAEMQRLGGRLALAGATLDRSTGLASADLAGAIGQANYRAGLHKSEIMRLTGAAQKSAAKYDAAATLISGAGRAYGAIS